MNEFIAELIGTFLLILLGNGIVANCVLEKTKGKDGGLIIITFGWGLAVFVGVWVAGPYSGAHLNPAISIGLATANLFSWNAVLPYILAQSLGAFIGQLCVWFCYQDHYKHTFDTKKILATHSTSPGISNTVSNLGTETIATFVLVFVVFFFSQAQIDQHPVLGTTKVGLGSIGALPVGLLVAVIGMGLGGPTGYAINPVRDLIPRIVHTLFPIANKGGSQWNYAWIPVFGPILGALVAGILYVLLFSNA